MSTVSGGIEERVLPASFVLKAKPLFSARRWGHLKVSGPGRLLRMASHQLTADGHLPSFSSAYRRIASATWRALLSQLLLWAFCFSLARAGRSRPAMMGSARS